MLASLAVTRPQSWTRVTAPTVEPVTLDQLRSHLRIDVTDEDEELEEIISDSREALENQYEVAFNTQTWDVFLDAFPSGWYNTPWVVSRAAIVLGRRPVQSVTSVKYIDSTGATVTLTPTIDYVVDGPGGRIVPAFGKLWPATSLQPVAGVQLRVVLGYGNLATDIPRNARRAVRLMCGHFYENREQVLLEQRIRPIDIPRGVDALMAPIDWRTFAA